MTNKIVLFKYKPFVYKQKNVNSYKVPLHKSKICKTKWNYLNNEIKSLTFEDIYTSNDKMKYIDLLIDDLRTVCYFDDLEDINEFDYMFEIYNNIYNIND